MTLRYLLGSLALAALAVACSSHKTPVPGKTCLLNTDCDNPLSCTFGKCHEACRENGDCPTGEICVFGKVQGADAALAPLRVCIKESCGLNSMCPEGLVCGKDLKCRMECMEDRDCTRSTDRCVPGGPNGELVCAEPAVIENGVVKPAPDAGGYPDASTQADAGADAPVDGGATDTGSAADAGADAPADAGVDAPADTGVDTPADAGVDSGADQGIDAGPPDLPIGPCGIPEAEPNDEAASATPYTIGTSVVGCIAMTPDYDFYRVTAPAGTPGNMAGGYFTASVTGVGNGTLSVYTFNGFDNGLILPYDSISTGVSMFFYWASRPGASTLVRISAYGANNKGAPYKYTFKADYTPINDPYEPNDTRDTAARITVGQPISAYYFTGYNLYQIDPVEYQDWYIVHLAAGPTTISVQSVPNQTALTITVLNKTGGIAASGGSPNTGAGFMTTFTATDDDYRVGISANPNRDYPADLKVIPPDSFTRAYTLQVTQ